MFRRPSLEEESCLIFIGPSLQGQGSRFRRMQSTNLYRTYFLGQCHAPVPYPHFLLFVATPSFDGRILTKPLPRGVDLGKGYERMPGDAFRICIFPRNFSSLLTPRIFGQSPTARRTFLVHGLLDFLTTAVRYIITSHTSTLVPSIPNINKHQAKVSNFISPKLLSVQTNAPANHASCW